MGPVRVGTAQGNTESAVPSGPMSVTLGLPAQGLCPGAQGGAGSLCHGSVPGTHGGGAPCAMARSSSSTSSSPPQGITRPFAKPDPQLLLCKWKWGSPGLRKAGLRRLPVWGTPRHRSHSEGGHRRGRWGCPRPGAQGSDVAPEMVRCIPQFQRPVCRTSAVPAKPGRRDLLSAESEVWGRPSRGSLSPPAPTRPAPVGGSAVTLRLSLVPPWKGMQDRPFDGTPGSEF